MSNPFANRSLSLSGPATDIVPVTPDDATDLPEVAVALYVETAGTIAFTSVSGGTRTVSVGSNSILPVGVRRVMASGTNASGIHAMVVA